MSVTVTVPGIVILAGGQSSRLGSPKQLLPYQGTTLLCHTVQVALDANLGPVVVVTGARAEEMSADLIGFDVLIIENTGWQEGMASSLRTGLSFLTKKFPQTDGVIFMVCDQPFVSKSVLLCLKDAQQSSGKAITASAYGDKVGTPALFHQQMFDKLLALKGDKGARMLIAEHPDDVTIVPFEEGITDVDTVEDYERLLNRI